MTANGLEIAYETHGKPDDRVVLLIAGWGAQLNFWDREFIEGFLSRGLRVVTFDNRDTGLSSKLTELGRPRGTAPYSIRDLANDTVGLLDALTVETAHLYGVSMGGMVAQSIAIDHPERVLSLTSVMSSTGSRSIPPPSQRVLSALTQSVPRGRDDYVDQGVELWRLLCGPAFPFDTPRYRRMVSEAYDRSSNAEGALRQMAAVAAAPDRTKRLGAVVAPTAVLHGSADPLVDVLGARMTADAIPNARLYIFDGVGHEIPRQLFGDYVDQSGALLERGQE